MVQEATFVIPSFTWAADEPKATQASSDCRPSSYFSSTAPKEKKKEKKPKKKNLRWNERWSQNEANIEKIRIRQMEAKQQKSKALE